MKFLPPLRYAMPALLGFVGLALVLLAFYDGLRRTEQLIENEASAQLMTFGTRIAARLEQVYVTEGMGGVHDVLIRTANEPHLRAAAVIDANGETIDSADTVLLGRSLVEFAQAEASVLESALATQTAAENIDATGNNLTAIFPFALPPNPGELRTHRFAALYLRNDIGEIKRLNWARHVERAWVMSAIVAIALAIVWAYFEWVVGKRLQRLSAAMHRAELGDLSGGDIDTSGRDELGRLGSGFAKMLDELRHRGGALAASEERYRSVVQAISEGVVVQRADGAIVNSNNSACRILGLTHEQLRGRNSLDPRWRAIREDGSNFPGELHPGILTLRTGRPHSGVVMGVRRPDGTLRWLMLNSEPCVLEAEADRRGVVTTFTDITERRNAEMRAHRDSERFAAIVDSAMDGVISVDAELRITVFNHAAEKMFGRPESDMLGRQLDELLPERFREAHRALMSAFAASGTTTRTMGFPGRVTGIRADGTEFPLEASITRVSVGAETVLTATLRDISERLRAEEQHAQLEAQLRQSQKMQSLGTLTGGIAHDFNNILTAISGNVKLAIADLPAENPAQRSLIEIERSAARATDLVRQVLVFGRRQGARRVVVDMAAVVDEGLKFLRAMIPANIEIRSSFPPSLAHAAVDPTQVHQVITNLGSNAAHAIGDRAGSIDVALEDVEVTEQSRPAPDLAAGLYVRLSFTDTGAGIEAAIIDRIFEPFFTTKELGQGTGLGLSVVHGIMRNHDGAIVAQSTLGIGTRFELFFPAASQAQRAAEPRVREHKETTAPVGKTVIYLDDEEALVFLVTRMLERHGYKVLGFTEPRRALAELARNPQRIDAVISDLAMPGMTGFDVVRGLHALRPELPVVLVSGYIRPQDTDLANTLGVRRLLLKPDTVEGLAQVLDEVLSERV